MPVMDSIGLEYRIDLKKLSNDIKRAKTKVNAFHNDLAKLAKKASITITVKGAQKAQQQVKQLSTSMQASLDKVGALKLKLGPESFGRIGGLVPRMTRDYEKLFQKFGKSPALLGRMNDSFKRVNKSLGEQAVRMENSGRSGQKFYNSANRVALVQQELAGNLKATATGIEKVTTASKKAATVASTTSQELRSMGVTSNMTAREIKGLGLRNIDLTRVLDLTKKRMGELKKEVGSGGKSATRAANEYRSLQRRMPELEHEVNKGIRRFGDYRRAMDRWGAGFKYMMASQAAWIASGAVLFGTLRLITQGMKDVVEYHQQMKGLEAITQANAAEMKVMERAINDAAVATKFFAADMGKAATLMAQAGFSADEVANSIGAVAILASATGKSLEDVADLMTTVIRAYDLHASSALRVANVLAAGISESKLQVDTLRTALNYMGVAAHQFNISIEDTVAWLGILRDRGMKASTIGTSFRGVLATLVKETDRFNKVLKELPDPLGYSDITIRRGRKLEDALKRLSEAGFDVTDAFVALPRRTAMTFSLMAGNVKSFEELRAKITDTSRAVEMNITMMKGLGSQLKQTKSIFDDIMRSFTRGGSALEPFFKLIKLLVQGFGSWIEIFGTLFQMIMKAAGAFGILGEAIKGLFDLAMGRSPRAVLDDLKGMYKEYQKDIRNLAGELEADLKRIFDPDIRTAGEKEKDALDKTLQFLYLQRDAIKASMSEVNKGTTEWKEFREQLILVNSQIRELEKSAGLIDDAIKGPLSDLKDIMLDLTVSPDMTAESLLAVFRKGTKDIELVRRAVAKLREEYTRAHTEWSEVLSKDSEEYERMVKLAKALVEAEKTLAGLVKKTNKEYYSRQKMIEKLYRKLQKDLRAAHKEWKKEDEFYDKFQSREYPVKFGIQEGWREFRRELDNEYATWKQMTYDMATALSDTMSDVFFEAMTGELKSMEDYWRAFTNVVKRLIADMAAQWVLFQAKTGVQLLFGGAGGITAGGYGEDIEVGHKGGIVENMKKMHLGGPGSGEALRILKNKEYVIKEPSVRSLGASGLDYANKTGQWPQGQTTVVNKNYLSIYAMDSESIDTAIRRGGGRAVNDLSLTAFARARSRKDPKVR